MVDPYDLCVTAIDNIDNFSVNLLKQYLRWLMRLLTMIHFPFICLLSRSRNLFSLHISPYATKARHYWQNNSIEPKTNYKTQQTYQMKTLLPKFKWKCEQWHRHAYLCNIRYYEKEIDKLCKMNTFWVSSYGIPLICNNFKNSTIYHTIWTNNASLLLVLIGCIYRHSIRLSVFHAFRL